MFLQSSKCKIPWSDRQIDETHKRASEDLDDYSIETDQPEKEYAKEKGLLQAFDKNDDISEDIEILQYNDEEIQEKTEKQSFYAMETFEMEGSEMSSQNGLSLKISLDLMKI